MDSKSALMGVVKVATIVFTIAAVLAAALCVMYGKNAEQKIMGAVSCLAVAAGFGWWVYRDWKKK